MILFSFFSTPLSSFMIKAYFAYCSFSYSLLKKVHDFSKTFDWFFKCFSKNMVGYSSRETGDDYWTTKMLKLLTSLNDQIALLLLFEQKGEVVKTHVKNTGRGKELLLPGAEVALVHIPGTKRKTAYDLIAVKKRAAVVQYR